MAASAQLLLIVVTISCQSDLLNAAGGKRGEEELLNWCLDAKHHKSQPGPESELYDRCTPWKSHACCTKNTSKAAHGETNHYRFNWDHCPRERPMSPDCKRHFIQDLCFYECEPNIGPWVVTVAQSYRKERFYKVPLCASDCQSWWNKCKDDYTCAYNWSRDFKWINGTNQCRKGAECQTFNAQYGSAKAFCEHVWDHSWQYTPDDEPCMRIWFNGSRGNPNRDTARFFARLMTSAVHCPPLTSLGIVLSMGFLFVVNIFNT